MDFIFKFPLEIIEKESKNHHFRYNITRSKFSVQTIPIRKSVLLCKRRSSVEDIFIGKYYIAVKHERVYSNNLVEQILIFKKDKKGNLNPNIYYAVPLDYNQNLEFFLFDQKHKKTGKMESFLATFDSD